jgi:hypothetical protein
MCSMQRVFANIYPCTLNLWSGYVGTLVLFNCYIWRCWTLYFRFRRAQAMEVRVLVLLVFVLSIAGNEPTPDLFFFFLFPSPP